MKKIVSIMLILSIPAYAADSKKDNLNRLIFDPQPVNTDQEFTSTNIIQNPKHIKSIMIVNGAWMNPVEVDKD